MTAAEVVQIRDADWFPPRPWACPNGMLVCSTQVDRDTWLEQRNTGLGASDVAAVFGVSKWATPWDVWASKTGRVQPEPENEAQLRGRILEDGIADLWAATLPVNRPVRMRRSGLMRHRRHSWMLATVDRLSVCPIGTCVSEIKSGVDLSDWEAEEVPVAYQLQVQQQLAVTGRDHAHIVLLGPRFQIVERVLERDDELIAQMVEQLGAWWQRHVVEDQEPDATAGAAEGLAKLYGNPDPDAVADLPPALVTVPDELEAVGKQIKELEERREDLQARLKQAAGNASIIRALGQTVATWKPTKQIVGADAAWRKANPELVEKYSHEKTVQVLDLAALVADHPELIGGGQNLYYERQMRGKKITGADAAWKKAHPDLVEKYSRQVTKTELDLDALVADHPDLIDENKTLRKGRILRLTN